MNVNMSKEEGTVHEYWQRRTNSKTPIEPWKTYPIMIRYSAANHTSPQSVFSRSASRGDAYGVMFVYTSGSVSNAYAWRSNVYAPIVFLKALWLLHSNNCLEDIDKEPKSLA